MIFIVQLYTADDFQLIYINLLKGTQITIHDHSNLMILFKLLKGNIIYNSYDKFSYEPITIKEYNNNIRNKKIIKGIKYRP